MSYVDDESAEEIDGNLVMEDIIMKGIEETKLRWSEEEDDDDEDYLIPPEAISSKDQVTEEYEEELTSYGWEEDSFYYNPYRFLVGGALGVFTIAAVWSILD